MLHTVMDFDRKINLSFSLFPVEVIGKTSHLPTLTFRGWALNRGTRQTLEIQNRGNLFQVLADLHSRWGFIELVIIAHYWKNTPEVQEVRELSEQKLFEAFGFRYNSQLQDLIKILEDMPPSFLIWAQHKGLNPKDMISFQLDCPQEFRTELLNLISHDEMSKSLGVQVLELATDLFLMGHSTQNVFKFHESPKHWVTHLKALRNPISEAKDNSTRELLNRLSPSKDMQFGLSRNGDSTRITFSGSARNPEELKKNLSTLLQKSDEII